MAYYSAPLRNLNVSGLTEVINFDFMRFKYLIQMEPASPPKDLTDAYVIDRVINQDEAINFKC